MCHKTVGVFALRCQNQTRMPTDIKPQTRQKQASGSQLASALKAHMCELRLDRTLFHGRLWQVLYTSYRDTQRRAWCGILQKGLCLEGGGVVVPRSCRLHPALESTYALEG